MENVIITFADGTSINAELNGTSYITDSKPDFPDDLSIVTITTGPETNMTIENARIIPCASVDGRFWFAILSTSQKEIEDMKLRADLDFLAAMVDVEL